MGWHDRNTERYERDEVTLDLLVDWVFEYPWVWGYLRTAIAVAVMSGEIGQISVREILGRALADWRQDRSERVP